MENFLPLHLQEVLFGSSDQALSKRISRLEKEGKIKKIAPRLYTTNLEASPEEIVRKHWLTILGNMFPGAILSHRSALEFQPTEAGHIFVTYKYTRKASLPGLTIRFLAGNGPVEGDNQIISNGELYLSQQARALLENLQVSRRKGPKSKILPIEKIEERIEQVIRVHGEEGANDLRDKAKKIAEELGMQKEFAKLNRIVSAMLTTSPSKFLTSPIAQARAMGAPYDQDRIELFRILFRALSAKEFSLLPDPNLQSPAFQDFAFFESYFSNYIEGTVFEVSEAQQIIETEQPMPTRNADSHDVLGTFKLVANPAEMRIVPDTPERLLEILKYRHRILLSARDIHRPGHFKDKDNFAGQTTFVSKELVQGTLIQAFPMYQSLRHPFPKAVFMMFLISEVHPFLDGNGRVARVMMNAELVSQGSSRILIPTVFREDYVLSLRKLTRQREPDAYIRMLERIRDFGATITGSHQEMFEKLTQANAFLEPTEANLRFP